MPTVKGGTIPVCSLFLLYLFLAACSSAPFRPGSIDDSSFKQRVVTQAQGAIRVSTSVPSAEEAEKIFGIPIYQRGVQPVWLEISNDGDVRARFVETSVDREYFSPFEVAYMYKKYLSKQGWKDLETFLFNNAVPRRIAPHQTVSGFVFTHAVSGTKAFNADVMYATEEMDYEQFTFFVEVPGFVPDHAEIDFAKLYSAEEIKHVSGAGLRTRIMEMPCCTSNSDNTKQGRPANVYFVASGRDMLRALLRAGWAETSYKRDAEYLASADYLFGRPPDAIFRKGRDKSTERIELGLWLAPVKMEGEPLWVGQFKHAIGRHYKVGELFLGVKLDPDVNDGRNFLLQDLWYAQDLEHWAWLDSGITVSREAPRLDFSGNPWFADDGRSVVIWVSGEPISLQEATQFNWDKAADETGATP